MSNYASIKIESTANHALYDVFNIGVSGSGMGTAFNITEICNTSRPTSGQYALAGVLFGTMSNLRSAIQLDYGARKILISIDSEYDITITATAYGCTFVTNTLPSNTTAIITPEVLPTFQIDDIEVVKATVGPPNDVCLIKFHRKTSYIGTAPFTMMVEGTSTVVNPIATDVNYISFIRPRNTIDNAAIDGYILQDSTGVQVLGTLPGLQYPSTSKITAEWINADNENGDVQLNFQLQVCSGYDVPITLQGQIETSLGSVLIAWQNISVLDPTGRALTLNMGTIALQDIRISLKDDFDGLWTGFIYLDSPILVGATIEIPKAQCLRFVNESNYSLPFHYDNRNLHDYLFKGRFYKPELQKFLTISNLWAQFSTNYDTVKAYLIKSDGTSTEITSLLSIIYSNNNINWYNLKPTITSLSGIYKIKLSIDDTNMSEEVYYSDWFEVVSSLENYSTLKWRNENDTYGYQDGMYWLDGEYQEMIIDGEFQAPDFGVDKSVLTDTNNRLTNLRSYPKAFDNLIIKFIDVPCMERFKLAFCHHEVLINNVEYQSEENLEFTKYKFMMSYHADLQLQRVIYENY